MKQDTTSWQRLTPDVIAQVPEAAAVFEVANLVRTVLYIGSAEGSLRAKLTSISLEYSKLPGTGGGCYFRYQVTAHEADQLAASLTAYRESHGGQLPAGNREAPRPLRLAARSAA